jgi:Ca2+-binding RTX toxin-like protein
MRALACLAILVVAGAASAYFAYGARVRGTPQADVLRGTRNDDRIDERGGNDRIFGYGGRDRLAGGTGNDTLAGGSSGDFLVGGPGDDRIDVRDPGGKRWTLHGRALTFRPLDYPRCADVILAGGGKDAVLMADRRFDAIWFCGGGRDVVVADRRDTVAGDCEVVRRH